MPPKVVLECVQGDSQGVRFAFDEREVCIMGRSPECRPVLPNDDAHLGISRHHCLIDINPPEIRVRDFGSLNGTFVNGKRIGQRKQGLDPDAARNFAYPEHDLNHGDLLQVGGTAFKILQEFAIYCNGCGDELNTVEGPVSESKASLCLKCRTRAETVRSHERVSDDAPACVACGEPVVRAGSSGALGHTHLCDRCRHNSDRVLDYAAQLEGLADLTSSGLGRYRIVEKIGHGGMGAVYKAEDKTTREIVALKVMLPEVAVNNKNVDLFLRESDVTRVLDHPNVVKLYDSGYERGIFYLCMRYCDGGSVEQRIEEAGGALSLEEALAITFQVLAGLDYAHNSVVTPTEKDGKRGEVVGIVHRDVKPKNILLDTVEGKRSALVCDFGLSKAFDLAGLSGLTCTGSVAGSPVYMPRQQVVNFKYSRPEVDIWATAASLYHMLTGTFPRNFEKKADPWRTVLETSAIPIQKRNPAIPNAIAAVIDRALIDRPEIRIKTAREFRERLEAAAEA